MEKISWFIAHEFNNKIELDSFLRTDYKMLVLCGSHETECNVFNHYNHKQTFTYYYCKSIKCIQAPGDSCDFQYRINYCTSDKIFRIYQLLNVQHSNKYVNESDDLVDKKIGIHEYYKKEILKIIENGIDKPMAIHKLLTKNKIENKYDPIIEFPTLKQIQGFKRRNNELCKSNGANEYQLVQEQLEKLKYYDGIDENKAFVYGVRLGVGTNEDPLHISATSLSLLKNININNDSFRIFHIDSTYKLINNRFNLIVFGRSDVNGQFHLIACSIISSETTESYKKFYRLIFTYNLHIQFTPPEFIVQDASLSEAAAAQSIFGSNIKILMCWFHLIKNIKKADSLSKVSKNLTDMVINDITRLHYCLNYEFNHLLPL
jgi:hypothetical protein